MRNNWIKDEIRKDAITTILEKFQGDQVRMMKKATNYLEADVYDNVEEELNIPYVNHEGIPLAMDVFKPIVEAGTELPVIVFIHGGGLITGDRRMSRNLARLFAHKGYLVFTIDYRLVPRANVCDQLDDVCAGLDFIGTKLADYDVDFGRIFMVGESAGAYLATYAAAMKKSRPLQHAIGHEPSRMVFRGIGLFSGMFYTQLHDPIGMMLSEQFYGEKTIDENFRKYMDPEHSEIIDNLPPAFFVTSRGDFLNNYTLKYQKAMEEAGKKTHLVYYGEKDLGHAFPAFDPTLPQSIEAIDKMLKWFEANVSEERKKAAKGPSKKELSVAKRIEDGSIREQKAWQYIYELNSVNEEKLDATALIDTSGRVSYRKMFRMWERYAAAFSGLGITGENHSRLGLIGMSTTELICALYAGNMTGAMVSGLPSYLPVGSPKFCTLIEEEGITDLFIMDVMIDPRTLLNLLEKKETLGLNNIILVHVTLNREINAKEMLMFSELNYRALRRVQGAVFWNDLLENFEGYPIAYAKYNKEEIAMAVHTSGTTKGINKPMFYTDYAWNATVHRIRYCDELKNIPDKPVTGVYMDMSGAYFIFDQIHLLLSLGGALKELQFALFVGFAELSVYQGTNVFIATESMLYPFENDDSADLSALDVVIVGGSYLSMENRQKLNAILKARGSNARVINGYGLSEVGGACILSPSTRDDDTIGFPLPGVNVMLYDEEDGKYYSIEDGPRDGVMHINSDSICTGKLGDKVFYEYTMIDGVPYINTFDKVRVNEDGSLTYIGRGNRYFVNTDGVRFDAGLIETAISSQDSVRGCAMVPSYDKNIHDTAPVLYIMVSGDNKVEVVKDALLKVYLEDNIFDKTNLPAKCVVADKLPYNNNGKIDVYKITKNEAPGDVYSIIPIIVDEKLVNIELVESNKVDTTTLLDTAGGKPEELGELEKPIGLMGLMMFAGKWGLL